MHIPCRYFRTVKDINEQEPYLQSLTDDQLKEKTAEFRRRLRAGTTLDDLLVESFALVREVSSRVLRLRHFDAQLVSSSFDSDSMQTWSGCGNTSLHRCCSHLRCGESTDRLDLNMVHENARDRSADRTG